MSNRFGREALRVGAVHIAVSAGEGGIRDGTDRVVKFNDLPSVVIPAGAAVVSDPVAFEVPARTDIEVSLYFPGHGKATTEHADAQQTSYVADGNVAGAAKLGGTARRIHSWYVITGMDVYAPGDSAVVAFGDSITDGWRSTPDEDRRWTDDFARRLAAGDHTDGNGVLGGVNGGISGNRVLQDEWGPGAISRIGRDILARDHARYVIVLEGINDIGRFAMDHLPYDGLARRLESGIAQIAAQAHLHGMRVIAGTLTPYRDSTYYSVDGDAVRRAVNEWIRTSPLFDGVVDFDKAVRDTQDHRKLAAAFDSDDHLHPNDAGYEAMADAIDLRLFSSGR